MMSLDDLSEPVRTAADLIWNYMQLGHVPAPADAILALGSNDERVAFRATELYLAGMAPIIVFSGGVGALTRGQFGGLSEAEHFARIAEARGVPRSSILIEHDSTNTGENIRFTRQLLEKSCAKLPSSVILVQKPFMERRTLATFLRQWPHPVPSFCDVATSFISRLPRPCCPAPRTGGCARNHGWRSTARRRVPSSRFSGVSRYPSVRLGRAACDCEGRLRGPSAHSCRRCATRQPRAARLRGARRPATACPHCRGRGCCCLLRLPAMMLAYPQRSIRERNQFRERFGLEKCSR